MEIIHRYFENNSRKETYTIIPLGDIHAGSKFCDEKLLDLTIDYIKQNDYYWIGMGDYCEFIRFHDKRFQPEILADWIEKQDLIDISKRQLEWIIEKLKPIASKCLGLVEGNHEELIKRHDERDVYSILLDQIKQAGGFATERLRLGFYGWLILHFERKATNSASQWACKIIAMHGSKSSELSGAKALNMDRWLWTHNADLTLIGHCHAGQTYRAMIQEVTADGYIHNVIRRGAYTGSFFNANIEGASSYAELKQLLPLPVGGVEVIIRPGANNPWERLKLVN